jgi:hypothetical protein
MPVRLESLRGTGRIAQRRYVIGCHHRFQGRHTLRSRTCGFTDDCENYCRNVFLNRVVETEISTILQRRMTLVVGWDVSRIGLKAGELLIFKQFVSLVEQREAGFSVC